MMMPCLLWRELTVVFRCLSFWAATAWHAIVVAAFLLVWGSGFPAATGSVFEQVAALQVGTLVVVLPWLAARCLGTERSAGLTALAAFLGSTPGHIVTSRSAASATSLSLSVVTTLPLLIVAGRISDAPIPTLAAHGGHLVGVCILVAGLATVAASVLESGLSRWLTTTLVVGLAAAILPSSPSGAAAMCAFGVLAAGATALWSERSLTFFADDMARAR